jgi:hypothetical protein
MRTAAIGLSVLALFLFTGCASLFNNKTPSVDIASDPGDAEVYVDGHYVGTTPVAVDMSIRKEHVITFRKEGYKDKSFQVSRFVGFGWIVLDVLGGLVPIIVDAATGDWFMLDTESVNVVLQPDN